TQSVSPAGNHLGWWVLAVPIVGGLIVGLISHYGSEKIRGHGIPEALEAILLRGSRVEPRVAVLKPVSSAIAIGSGGPFGAEGPIIMTGGAVGSLIAQFFHLTDSERKTLLVAGSAAGMAAIFAAPVAAVLLAVELLLFEWKPRSLVPVALAGHRRNRRRHRRIHFPARARSGLRRHRQLAQRRSRAAFDRGHSAGQDQYLVVLAGLGKFRRNPGAHPDDGRRTGRCRRSGL